MKNKFKFFSIVFIFIFCSNLVYSKNNTSDALIFFKTTNYDSVKLSLELFKKDGYIIKFVYPPNLIIASLKTDIKKDDYKKYRGFN